MIIMTEQNNMRNQKDKWDKFEIISKGVLAILLPAAVAFYGLYSEYKSSLESETNRSIQILIQALAGRESAGAQMKSNMFETIMGQYFKEQSDKSKITTLELIALNFKDQFLVRPMFENLNAEFTFQRI